MQCNVIHSHPPQHHPVCRFLFYTYCALPILNHTICLPFLSTFNCFRSYEDGYSIANEKKTLISCHRVPNFNFLSRTKLISFMAIISAVHDGFKKNVNSMCKKEEKVQNIVLNESMIRKNNMGKRQSLHMIWTQDIVHQQIVSETETCLKRALITHSLKCSIIHLNLTVDLISMYSCFECVMMSPGSSTKCVI